MTSDLMHKAEVDVFVSFVLSFLHALYLPHPPPLSLSLMCKYLISFYII